MQSKDTNLVILDAREPKEFKVSHIKLAVYAGFSQFSATKISHLINDKSRPVVVYCSLRIRSKTISEKLKKEGLRTFVIFMREYLNGKTRDIPFITSLASPQKRFTFLQNAGRNIKKTEKKSFKIIKNNQLKSENLLLIFTRNPELGKVKSRLAKDVGEKSALRIYEFLLEHTATVTKNLSATKVVYYSEAIWDQDIWNNQLYSKKLQQGEDLGDRMLQAFKDGFKNGYKNIIIIGSDLYELETKDLETAFRLLQQKDAVIGPATDGGYYLLGMSKLYPEVFKQKAWGTSSVLEATLEDLNGTDLGVLEARNDVDHFSDIKDHPDFQQFF